jgi:hypothetical protein
MTKEATVPQELAEKFKTEKDSSDLRFVRAEGLDVISAQYVPNLRTVELKPWARRNGKGRLGGNQVDYADEEPLVRRMFADALVKHDMSSRMDAVYAAELANLPPKAAAIVKKTQINIQRSPQFRTAVLLICLDIAIPQNLCCRDCIVWVLNTGPWRKHMEKVVLLCLIIVTISALAEIVPACRRHD